MRPSHILVVDDEDPVRRMLERAFTEAGFSVSLAASAAEIPGSIKKQMPDLVILDYNLPESTGRDACIKLRRDESTRFIPIIMITGSGIEGLPADCLQSGADDFVPKPFNLAELVARVRAVLRRPRTIVDEQSDIQKGPLVIQPEQRQILINGKPIERLTPKEFDLLHQIILHAPRVLPKNVLALKVWGQTVDLLHDRTLDVHIRRIRSKLGKEAAACLVTVPAIGYRWVDIPLA
jgi:two-component system phosphate regulon response regulator PhoB